MANAHENAKRLLSAELRGRRRGDLSGGSISIIFNRLWSHARFRNVHRRYREAGRKIAILPLPLEPPEAYRKNIRISAGTLRRAEQLKDEREAHGRAWGERTVVRPEIRGTELARGLRIRAFEGRGGGERELITFLRFKV